jgi:secondary thiamine-phosphate synthase enzyme
MERISLKTNQRIGFYDITDKVRKVVKDSGVKDGIGVIYIPHTTAAVVINENYDPTVCEDINRLLTKLTPEQGGYAHTEGNADAHIKASIIGSSKSIIIKAGELRLGRWQGIFFCEFDGPRSREVWIEVLERR